MSIEDDVDWLPGYAPVRRRVRRAAPHTAFGAAAGGVRGTDPNTSRVSAERVAVRTGSQRYRLLLAWRDQGEASTATAGFRAGLSDHQAGRRSSELLQYGLIEWTGAEIEQPETGGRQRVMRITEAGLEALSG